MPLICDPFLMTPLLRKLESIATLNDEEREAIESLPVKVRALRSRQDIACEGDKPSQCCIILEGWAYRYKLNGEGRRQILSFHVAGDIPDLQSLNVPVMDHNLATLTNATVAFIPHENARDLTNRYPGIAAAFWRDTLIDAGILRAWIMGLGRRDAYERMARLICELYLRQEAVGLAQDYSCCLPVTQSDLGDALGLSNVHVNRVLQEMRSQGLVTLRNGKLAIERWDELAGAGEFDPAYLQLKEAIFA